MIDRQEGYQQQGSKEVLLITSSDLIKGNLQGKSPSAICECTLSGCQEGFLLPRLERRSLVVPVAEPPAIDKSPASWALAPVLIGPS